MPIMVTGFSSGKGSPSIRVMFREVRAGEILPSMTKHRNPGGRESDCLERIDAGVGKL